MSEGGGLDLGKVIGMIMENPELVEQISAMAKGSQGDSVGKIEASQEVDGKLTEAVSQPAQYQVSSATQKSNRAQLLEALKPYVSADRGRAIDSMLTIATILDAMKTR